MLKIGDKIICTFGSPIDKTTVNKVYEVKEIKGFNFLIKNDKGLVSMPIESIFKKIKG